MEHRKFEDKKEPEIVYSKSVKAGKRIYYLDVKKARNEDLYLCITESKKHAGGENEAPQFEKHKVFLYREDFAHFSEALQDTMAFIQAELGDVEPRPEWTPENTEVAAEAPAVQEEKEESKKKGFFSLLRG